MYHYQEMITLSVLMEKIALSYSEDLLMELELMMFINLISSQMLLHLSGLKRYSQLQKDLNSLFQEPLTQELSITANSMFLEVRMMKTIN